MFFFPDMYRELHAINWSIIVLTKIAMNGGTYTPCSSIFTHEYISYQVGEISHEYPTSIPFKCLNIYICIYICIYIYVCTVYGYGYVYYMYIYIYILHMYVYIYIILSPLWFFVAAISNHDPRDCEPINSGYTGTLSPEAPGIWRWLRKVSWKTIRKP